MNDDREPVGGGLNRVGKLIYSMSVSLDGFVETPSRSLDWVNVDEELHAFFNDEAREVSAFLYGRRLYELMTEYWPTAEADPSATPTMVEFARIWKDKPKIVFSTSLERVEFNSRLVREKAADEVARLKAQPGFDMSVGGPKTAATFMPLGLIDEYRVCVHPVILGAGTRFFPPLDDRIGLKLLETRTFGSGVVFLRYEIGSASAETDA
jgi:dihydrofolate reductase